MQNLLQLVRISKSFGGEKLFCDLCLEVGQYESLAIVGRGGSGKSSLLKIMALLLKPDAGAVLYNGAPVYSLAQVPGTQLKIACVFQNDALFDSLSVFENVALYFAYHGSVSVPESQQRVQEILQAVSLDDVANMPVNNLSGGMRKRVALARALVYKANLLFLDEPTAGLDPIATERVCALILKLQKLYSLTVVFVTSDMDCVKMLASHVLILYNHAVYAKVPKGEFFRSRDPFIQNSFLGELR